MEVVVVAGIVGIVEVVEIVGMVEYYKTITRLCISYVVWSRKCGVVAIGYHTYYSDFFQKGAYSLHITLTPIHSFVKLFITT